MGGRKLKKKISILLIFILLITYTIPALGFTGEQNNKTITFQEPDQDYRSKVKHLDDSRLPPIPGEIPSDFVFESKQADKIISNPPKKTLQSDEETIIDILENLSEDLILGYLEDLVAFGPRVTNTSACKAAGDYIYNEFVSYGLNTRYHNWTIYGYATGRNIEGSLYGLNETSDEIYIICAHYDSVNGSPGADDDGSGTAAVLAAAHLMSQYKFNHTIRFVTFDGEEQGILGSYKYAEEAKANGDNITAVLNGDMIGYAENPSNESNIDVYDNNASHWITNFTEEVCQKYNDYIELTVIPSGPTYGSDHASFWDFGYNAIMYHEHQITPYYHSPQDIIENTNINYSTRISKLMIATLGELAEALGDPPETPTKPDGPETLIKDVEATFESTTTDPEGRNIYYLFDWGDGTDSGWIGPYPSGQTGEASYAWTEIGEFEVKVTAKDIYNVQSNWSEPHVISIVENQNPTNPKIKGPSWGLGGKKYEFTFISTDPEGYDIYYKVDWDDGYKTDWLGPYSSGKQIALNHSWNKKGEYLIKAWAKDTLEDESGQGNFRIKIITNDKSLKNKQGYRNLLITQILENLTNRFPIIDYLLNG
jgi:hypothetical protein